MIMMINTGMCTRGSIMNTGLLYHSRSSKHPSDWSKMYFDPIEGYSGFNLPSHVTIRLSSDWPNSNYYTECIDCTRFTVVHWFEPLLLEGYYISDLSANVR